MRVLSIPGPVLCVVLSVVCVIYTRPIAVCSDECCLFLSIPGPVQCVEFSVVCVIPTRLSAVCIVECCVWYPYKAQCCV